MHSFAMTERHLVLVAFPLVVNPLQLALGGRPFIENYRWKPELGHPRSSSSTASSGELVRTCEADACFSFHHINAFERGSELVIDMAAYDDASIVDSLYLDRVRTDPPTGIRRSPARLRYRIAPDSDQVVAGRAQRRRPRAAADRLRRAQRTPLPATSTGSAPTATATRRTSSTS